MWKSVIIAFVFGVAACSKGVDPADCQNEYTKILNTYQTSCATAQAQYVNNPVASMNNHNSYVTAVNAAVDVANTAAVDPRLSGCSGWTKLPHIQ